jgi:hypothetical protein
LNFCKIAFDRRLALLYDDGGIAKSKDRIMFKIINLWHLSGAVFGVGAMILLLAAQALANDVPGE